MDASKEQAIRLVPFGRFVRHRDTVYIQWDIAEAVPIKDLQENRHYPPVLKMLISPADARAFAESLLRAASVAQEMQDGGGGHPGHRRRK